MLPESWQDASSEHFRAASAWLLVYKNQVSALYRAVQPLFHPAEDIFALSQHITDTVTIDFFKQINDRYGHDAVDIVLHELAERYRKALHDPDIVCRYGGEEFAVLLAESEIHGAEAAVKRLFHSIADQPIQTGAGPVAITISVGVSTFCPQCNTLEKLLKCADLALYQAKAEGRNQVRIWKSES